MPPSGDAEWDIRRLIADYHAALYRYAFRLSGDVADAEDLTQQAFLIAHQKIGQVRESAKVKRWLFRVLRNCFLKSCRKMRPVNAGAIEMEIDEIPADVTEDEIDRQQLQLALNDLPPEFRVVVTMFYFEEMSYKEIAAELEIKIGTVMSRLSRGKTRLRQRLFRSHAAGAREPDAPQPAYAGPGPRETR